MPLPELLANYIMGYTYNNLAQSYQWPIPDYVGLEIPNIDGETLFAQNLNLRMVLHERWIAAGNELKGQIVEYYISRWGGIHSNSADRMFFYKNANTNELIQQGRNGIASYSKALVIHDPSTFAIFDARVAYALTALQILHFEQEAYFVRFPLLPTRNTNLLAAKEDIKNFVNGIEVQRYRNENYQGYCKLLHQTIPYLDHWYNQNFQFGLGNPWIKLQVIEMVLFSESTALVQAALDQMN